MSHKIDTYTELKQQIHDDLRVQHPDWIGWRLPDLRFLRVAAGAIARSIGKSHSAAKNPSARERRWNAVTYQLAGCLRLSRAIAAYSVVLSPRNRVNIRCEAAIM